MSSAAPATPSKQKGESGRRSRLKGKIKKLWSPERLKQAKSGTDGLSSQKDGTTASTSAGSPPAIHSDQSSPSSSATLSANQVPPLTASDLSRLESDGSIPALFAGLNLDDSDRIANLPQKPRSSTPPAPKDPIYGEVGPASETSLSHQASSPTSSLEDALARTSRTDRDQNGKGITTSSVTGPSQDAFAELARLLQEATARAEQERALRERDQELLRKATERAEQERVLREREQELLRKATERAEQERVLREHEQELRREEAERFKHFKEATGPLSADLALEAVETSLRRLEGFLNPNEAPALGSSPPRIKKDGQPGKRILPDELHHDSDMLADLDRFIPVCDRLLKDRRLNDENTTRAWYKLNAQLLEFVHKNEDSYKTMLQMLIAPLTRAVACTLADVVSDRKLTGDSDVCGILELFPNVPWDKLTDKLAWVTAAPGPDPEKTPFSQSSKTKTAAKSSAAKASSAKSSIAKSSIANSSTHKSSTNRPSITVTSTIGSVRSDLFTIFRSDQGKEMLCYFTETKKPTIKGSIKVKSWFMRIGQMSIDVDNNAGRVAGSSNDTPIGRISIMSLFDSDTKDKEMAGIIRQCFTYILKHERPFVLLPVGMTYVFLRYDYKDRLRSLEMDQSGKRVPFKLLYYVESPSPKADIRDNDNGSCQPQARLAHALLFFLLKSLSDLFSTTAAESREWLKDLESRALIYDNDKELPRTPMDAGHAARDNSKRDEYDDQDPNDTGEGKAERKPGRTTRSGQSNTAQDRARAGSQGPKGAAGKGRTATGGTNKHAAASGSNFDGEKRASTRSALGVLDRNVAHNRQPQRAQGESNSAFKQAKPIVVRVSMHKKKQEAAKVTVVDVATDGDEVGADGSQRCLRRHLGQIGRYFCTPQCLLGLRCGLAMDPRCPNVLFHCTRTGCKDHAKHTHPHSLEHVKSGMRDMLSYDSIKQTMEPIVGSDGIVGQLFRFFHPTLGYAFAAKGVYDDEDSLKREHDIYEYIWKTVANTGKGNVPLIGALKGSGRGKQVKVRVPISFGVIEPSDEYWDVVYPFYPAHGDIERKQYNRWLLLSYHSLNLGQEAAQQKVLKRLPAQKHAAATWEDIRMQCEEMLLRLGIRHNDLHLGNMLWCQRLQSIVLIDFERAKVVIVSDTSTDQHPGEESLR